MTYISWSSDFALYLEDYLMYEHHTLDYESVWHDIWPQNKCRSLWPVFHGPVILPYILRTIWCMNIILWDYKSVWHDIWPQNKCRSTVPYISWSSDFVSQYDPMFILKINLGNCDLNFMVQWFCLIFSGWTSYFGIMSQYDLKIFVGHCDLYFMVHWICLTSWRLFDVWTLYFVIMSQCNAAFALKQCRSQ